MRVNVIVLLVFLGSSVRYTSAQTKQCVTDAQRNADGECVCNEGFHGNGHLCCIPDDHKMCMVEADPVIRTMNGDHIQLDLPCPIEMAHIHTTGIKYDETVYAYVAGEYGRNGILNLDHLRLVYWERFNKIHTIIEVFNSKLTINGKVQDREQTWASEQWEVSMRYNGSTDTYTMMSMGTTIIHFVPPSQSTDEQRSVPGLCIGVAENSLLYEIGMCNQRKRGLQRSSYNQGFEFLQAGVAEFQLRNLPTEEDVGPPDVQARCLDINRSKKSCSDKWVPSIGSCFIIVSQPEIRYCLAKSNLNILEVFHECTRAQCGLNEGSCSLMTSEAVKKCVNVEPNCNALYLD